MDLPNPKDGEGMKYTSPEDEAATTSSSTPDEILPQEQRHSREDGRVVLKDFILESSDGCENGLAPEALKLSLFGLEEEGEDSVLTKQVLPALWEYPRVIELRPGIRELTFVAWSEAAGDLGFFSFTEDELLAFMAVERDLSLERNFEMNNNDKGWLKISFSACAPEADKSHKNISGGAFSRSEPTLLSTGNDTSHAEHLCAAAVALFQQFETSGVLSHLDQAISSMEAGISHTPNKDVDLAGRLHNCGNLFRIRFEHKGNIQDLEMVIWYMKKALETAPEDFTLISIIHNSLGNVFRLYFECTGDIINLENAIMYQRKSVQLTPEGSHYLPSRLNDLATSLRIRFQHIGNRMDLESALLNHQTVVRLTPKGHPARPGMLNSLGGALFVRFDKLTGDLDDLNDAIANLQQAIQLQSMDSPNMPLCLANIGTALETRFTYKGDFEDLNNAIHYLEQAVKLTHEDNPNWPGLLSTLGATLYTRFGCSGDIMDLANSISNQQKAVERTAMTHINLPTFLSRLGNALDSRFQRTGDREDIDNIIFNQEKALQLLPEANPDLPKHLLNLVKWLTSRFMHFGDIQDIDRAIAIYQRVVEISPKGHPESPIWLSDLSASFVIRFQHFGETNDIKNAISDQERAILIELAGNTSHRQLSNLGAMYYTRFQHFGDLLDIERAILNLQKAIQATPEEDPELPRNLTNLASAFCLRFGRTGDVVDIQKAIRNQERAVRLTPADHAGLPGYLTNLGCCFVDCFNHTNDLEDIESGVSNLQRAVDLAPNNSSTQLHRSLHNLASSLRVRFRHTRNLTDIGSAISNSQRAIDLAPKNHADLPYLLADLGVSFSQRFEQTKDRSDIQNAISNIRRAVQILPKEHAKRATYLSDLAFVWLRLYNLVEDPEDAGEVFSLFRMAGTQRSGDPSIRLVAATNWARMARYKDVNDAGSELEAYRVAIGLLPQVAGLEQTIRKRHKSLIRADIADLTASATAAAITNGDIDLALAWLEQGRCLVWNQINQLRAPANRLHEHDPSLAERFLNVARSLEASAYREQEAISFSITPESVAFQSKVHTHAQLAKNWDQLLSEIRVKPGLEDFLQPPNATHLLKHLPREGPVVVFNIDEARCDALALVSGCDEPIHIPLESFTYEQACQLSRNLRLFLQQKSVRIEVDSEDIDRAGRKAEHDIAQNTIYHILRTLWLDVVKPVFDALAFSTPPAHRPRIWWCPTGPLSFLPIHAAGIYGPEKDEFPVSDRLSVSDFVISSYTPTVSMLLDKLQEASGERQKEPSVLLVSQPVTPGCNPLPGAKLEMEVLKMMMEERGVEPRLLENEVGTIARVKQEMSASSWVHFACHAVQHTAEPVNSGFHLHDGLLQLHDIMSLNIANAEHAFLSACQTSTGDVKLSDEAVHLAAGMLAAGYRGVVATMWSIWDQFGPEIASNFYSHLLENEKSLTEGRSGVQTLSGAGAAHALDFSTRKIREKLGDGERALLAWLPYVHFGV